MRVGYYESSENPVETYVGLDDGPKVFSNMTLFLLHDFFLYITRGVTVRQPLRNSRTDCTYDAKPDFSGMKKYTLLKRIIQTCAFISLETIVTAYPFQRHYCISFYEDNSS